MSYMVGWSKERKPVLVVVSEGARRGADAVAFFWQLEAP